MPQMAPLNWLTLMLMFILILSIFNMMNYFSFNYNTAKTKKTDIITKKINWKW